MRYARLSFCLVSAGPMNTFLYIPSEDVEGSAAGPAAAMPAVGPSGPLATVYGA